MKLEIEKIKTVTNECLNRIDLSKYYELLNIDSEYKNYFLDASGKEHYRLLIYISNLFNEINILDIGTNRGFSAVALSDNKKNAVISYDLIRYESVKTLMNSEILNNVEFKLGNFIESENLDKYKIILLDTDHDGKFEKFVIEHLEKVKWNGILLMDDILYFPALTEIWNNLKQEKYNLTKTGHISGTGMVIFKGE